MRTGLFALRYIADLAEGFVDTRLAAVGLSVPKFAALYRLVEAGESLPLGQLADRLACVKSNVTQLVDRLEADGLVARAADPNDRRSRLAVLTPEGRAAYDEGLRMLNEAEHQIFGSLSEAESNQFLEIVKKLRDGCSALV